MSDEERIRNTSSSSNVSFRNGGNGRNSKKPKLKKIPQRGLGVAQLEKVRLEEEVKNDTLTLPSPAVTTSRPMMAPSLHNPSLSVPPFSLHPRLYSFGADTLYGHVPCQPHLPVRHHGLGPSLAGTQMSNAGVSVGLPSAIFPTEGPASNLLSSGYIGEVEKAMLSLNPPSESNFTSPSFYLSSTVNADAGNSLSAVLNFQKEPPSNQSPFGTYRSVQPDEYEKIAGTKRPCPFMLQDPSEPFLQGKFNPHTIHSLGRSTSFGNPGSSVINGNLGHREGVPCSMSMPELHRTNDLRTDCAMPDGDFLKLAPPTLPSSKSKQALCAELLELGSIHSQVVHVQDSNSAVSESKSSIHHHQDHEQQWRPFHSLFSAHNNARRGQPADGSSRYQNGEAEDHVDLNLKL